METGKGEARSFWFDPAKDDDIKKIRTAVVVSEGAIGRKAARLRARGADVRTFGGPGPGMVGAAALGGGSPGSRL